MRIGTLSSGTSAILALLMLSPTAQAGGGTRYAGSRHVQLVFLGGAVRGRRRELPRHEAEVTRNGDDLVLTLEGLRSVPGGVSVQHGRILTRRQAADGTEHLKVLFPEHKNKMELDFTFHPDGSMRYQGTERALRGLVGGKVDGSYQQILAPVR
jgi:hypothetical protein